LYRTAWLELQTRDIKRSNLFIWQCIIGTLSIHELVSWMTQLVGVLGAYEVLSAIQSIPGLGRGQSNPLAVEDLE